MKRARSLLFCLLCPTSTLSRDRSIEYAYYLRKPLHENETQALYALKTYLRRAIYKVTSITMHDSFTWPTGVTGYDWTGQSHGF